MTMIVAVLNCDVQIVDDHDRCCSELRDGYFKISNHRTQACEPFCLEFFLASEAIISSFLNSVLRELDVFFFTSPRHCFDHSFEYRGNFDRPPQCNGNGQCDVWKSCCAQRSTATCSWNDAVRLVKAMPWFVKSRWPDGQQRSRWWIRSSQTTAWMMKNVTWTEFWYQNVRGHLIRLSLMLREHFERL